MGGREGGKRGERGGLSTLQGAQTITQFLTALVQPNVLMSVVCLLEFHSF